MSGKTLVLRLYYAAAIAYIVVELADVLVERVADRVGARLEWRFRNLVDHFASVHAHLDHLEGDADKPEPAKR